MMAREGKGVGPRTEKSQSRGTDARADTTGWRRGGMGLGFEPGLRWDAAVQCGAVGRRGCAVQCVGEEGRFGVRGGEWDGMGQPWKWLLLIFPCTRYQLYLIQG